MTETLSSLKQFWLGLLAAFANLALLVVHPFLVFMTPLVLGFFWVFLAARAKRILWHQAIILVLIYLPSLPFLLYYFQVLRTNPVIAAWNAQAVTLSPNPLHYLLAYAPYLALAGWGAVHLKGKLLDSPERILLWLWVLVVALLLYAPIGAQRRFVEGVQVPLAILATLGLYEVALPRLERAAWFQALAHRPNYSVAGLRRLLMVALVAILAVPNLYLYVGALSSLGIQQAYPLFRPRAETAAMDWLKASVPPDSLVLSAYVTGSYLPYRAGTLSYIGQRYETIGFETKQRLVEAFFSSQSDADRLAFLQQNSIDYIFYGRAERDLGSFDPSKAKFLKSVWRNDQVQIYNLEQP